MNWRQRLTLFIKTYGSAALGAFIIGVILFSSLQLHAQTAVYPAGDLHEVDLSKTPKNQSTDQTSWSCDSAAYTLMPYQFSTGDTNENNTNWFACVPNNRVATGCSLDLDSSGGGYFDISWSTTNASSASYAVDGATTTLSGSDIQSGGATVNSPDTRLEVYFTVSGPTGTASCNRSVIACKPPNC